MSIDKTNPTQASGEIKDRDKQIQIIMEVLAESKAVDIQLLDLQAHNSFTDFMILGTGTSTRHVSSISDRIQQTVKRHNIPLLGIEGQKYSEWIAIDLGDVVVHLMLADVREYYAIEKLWLT